MKKITAFLSSLAILALFFPAVNFGNPVFAETQNGIFPDVPVEHPHAAAIRFLKERGIVSGDGRTGLFLPERILNRAEFSRMIVSALGLSTDIPFSPIFPDVPQQEWYTPYILTSHQMGILLGTAEGRAEPGRSVLMVEALAMSLRAFGLASYSEVRSEPWFNPYLRFAQEKRILEKIDTEPIQGLPRKEAAQILVNVMNLNESLRAEILDVLVCRMSWPNTKASPLPQLINVMNETNRYLQEASYGKVRLRVRYAGNIPYRGPIPENFEEEIKAALSTCDPLVDFSTLTHLIIYPSKTTDLSFSVKQDVESNEGIKKLGVLFIKDFLTGHLAHEFGHTLKATHTHGLECGDAPVKREGCRTSAYGNPYDVLGEPTFTAHYLGWNKAHFLNWTTTQEISEGDTYTLPAIELPSQKPHVLRIPYGEESGLCVEYRKPIGFDDFASRRIRDRIANLVRFPREGALLLSICPTIGSIHLIDVTPGSQTNEDLADFADAYLPAGKVFANDIMKIRVSFESLPNNEAAVTIQKEPDGFIPTLFGF